VRRLASLFVSNQDYAKKLLYQFSQKLVERWHTGQVKTISFGGNPHADPDPGLFPFCYWHW